MRLLDDRFEFVPCLGDRAPHDLPLRMVVTHTGRGELSPVGAVTRTVHDLRVDYTRPELREQLVIQPEGVKQSFVFTELPKGTGDLVVRVRITSELQAVANESAGALRLLFGECGGVEIGQVLGIDATGRRVTGRMRCVDDRLDCVLPGAFVDSAVLPLVLDPLIAPVVVAETVGNNDSPQIALLPGSGSFCVVWRRAVSATNHDVMARRFQSTGTPLLGVLALEATNADADTPRVACVGSSGWITVWAMNGNIHAAQLPLSATGSLPFVVTATSAVEVSPDISGGAGAQCVVVWRNSTANAIEARSVHATAQGATVVLATGGLFGNVVSPSVSPFTNSSSLLLTYVASSSALGSSVRGLIVDRSTTSGVGTSFPIATGSALVSVANPVNAGDGNVFVVAHEASGLLGNRVTCTSVRHDAGVVEIGPARALTAAGATSTHPKIAMVDNSVLVAWTRPNGTANEVLVTSIDPFTCADCEGESVVAVGAQESVAVAGVSSFAAFGGIAWAGTPSTQVLWQRFFPVDGGHAALAGACGGVGRIYGTSAVVGNASFGFQLLAAPPAQLSLLVLSTSVIPGGFACGACTVQPDFTVGAILFTGVTSAVGGARYDLPIPVNGALSGVDLVGQFALSGSNCLGFDLTNGLRVTID